MNNKQTTKWVLVAGGSGGLGAAIARVMAEDGWNVALTYNRSRDAAQRTAAAVEAEGVNSSIHQLDLTDAQRTASILSELPHPLHGVVYAAGPKIPMRYVSELPPELFAQQLVADAVGCYNLLQQSIPRLRETRGVIVALSTPAVIRFAKKDLLSAAPKGAVQQIVRSIAAEEGRHGIRANCVGVGLIEGEGMWTELVESGEYTAELLATAKRNIALREFGRASDIAEAVRFLLTDRARWVTGQSLNVDGGFSV